MLVALSVSTALSSACTAPNAQAVQASEGASVVYPEGKWRLPAAKYGVVLEDDVKVLMDDGVELSATVAYPVDKVTGRRAAGKFPVIVEHMPYEKFAVPITVNGFFAEHGYISVLVRARGTGKSGGEIDFLGERDGLDGKAVVDWASKLDGSDGRVALQGCSWPGAIALNDAAAVGKNSPLKAVIASCSGLENMPRQSWFNGGMPTMSFWSFGEIGQNLVGNNPATARYFEYMVDQVKQNGDVGCLGRYWQSRGRAQLAEKIVANNIPVMLNAGWQGVVEMGTVRAYTALQNAYAGRPVYAQMTANQKVSPRWQVIMGGWDHGQGLDMELYLQWLNTWLKGVDTGLQNSTTPMHLFEQGTNRWVNLTGYPVINASVYKLGKGTLTQAQTQGQDMLDYTQPNNKNGTLVFTGEPFKEGATLSGAISATLYAQSSTPNLVFIAHLYDVAPNGEEMLISRGALLGSRRAIDREKSWTDANGVVMYPWQTFAQDQMLDRGKTYRFDVSLNTRQWGIKPNHRIKLVLTSQTPAEQCPSTGVPTKNDAVPCRLNAAQTASLNGGRFTLLYGKDTPSSLNLPQLAYQAQPAVPSGKLALLWNEGERRFENARQENGGDIGNLLPAGGEFTYPLKW